MADALSPVSRKRSSVDGARSAAAAAEKNLPRICIWESNGEAADITCDIINTLELYGDETSFELAVVRTSEPVLLDWRGCEEARADDFQRPQALRSHDWASDTLSGSQLQRR